METDQSESSAMALEVKLTSGEIDQPFICSSVASFSSTKVWSAASISSASCLPLLFSLVFVSHLE